MQGHISDAALDEKLWPSEVLIREPHLSRSVQAEDARACSETQDSNSTIGHEAHLAILG